MLQNALLNHRLALGKLARARSHPPQSANVMRPWAWPGGQGPGPGPRPKLVKTYNLLLLLFGGICCVDFGGPWALGPCPPKCKCYEAQGLARGPRPRARPLAQTGENTLRFATFLLEAFVVSTLGGPGPWSHPPQSANVMRPRAWPGGQGPGPGPRPKLMKTHNVLLCFCWRHLFASPLGGPGPWAHPPKVQML